MSLGRLESKQQALQQVWTKSFRLSTHLVQPYLLKNTYQVDDIGEIQRNPKNSTLPNVKECY